MKVKLSPDFKVWMVREASQLADRMAATQPQSSRGPNDDESDEGRGGDTSQLRNLIQITRKESEVPVLRNFIEYQAARRATEDFWLPVYKQVIKALEEIAERCESEATGDEVERRRFALQSFFEYMVRRYVFQTKIGDGATQGARGGGAGVS